MRHDCDKFKPFGQTLVVRHLFHFCLRSPILGTEMETIPISNQPNCIFPLIEIV